MFRRRFVACVQAVRKSVSSTLTTVWFDELNYTTRDYARTHTHTHTHTLSHASARKTTTTACCATVGAMEWPIQRRRPPPSRAKRNRNLRTSGQQQQQQVSSHRTPPLATHDTTYRLNTSKNLQANHRSAHNACHTREVPKQQAVHTELTDTRTGSGQRRCTRPR